MSGLPFGAAQQHDVPQEKQNFDNIEGIEFIELDASLPYPRSAAYRRTPDGAEMLIRRNTPEVERVMLSSDEARAYIESVVEAGLFAWQRVYRPAQGTFVNASTEWRVKVEFAQTDSLPARKTAGKNRPFESEGENVFPDTYERVVRLLVRADAGVEIRPEQLDA